VIVRDPLLSLNPPTWERLVRERRRTLFLEKRTKRTMEVAE
jgi:hypothetical protein